MSYGISITNNNNETVVDAQSSLLVVETETTLSPNASNNTQGPIWYRYTTPANKLVMFNIPVGHSLVRVTNEPTYFWSTLSSASVAYCDFAKDVTLSSGYGMRVFDASGNAVFDASEKTLIFKGLYRKQGAPTGAWSPQATQGGNYFTIPTNDIGSFYGPEPAGAVFFAGFRRNGTSSIEGVGFSAGTGVGPFNVLSRVTVLEAG